MRLGSLILCGLASLAVGALLLLLTRDHEPALRSVAGTYEVRAPAPCGRTIELRHSGRYLSVVGADGRPAGRGELTAGSDPGRVHVSAVVECDGRAEPLRAIVRLGHPTRLTGSIGDRPLTAALSPQPAGERRTATAQRAPANAAAAFLLAVAVVVLAAGAGGALAVRARQPRVIGELLAGIALGPTLLGAVGPGVQAAVFPPDILPALGTASNLGLVFFMFLIGLQLDAGELRRSLGRATTITATSFALPMALGIATAVPLYGALAPDTSFAAFVLFIGVALSITAVPVLARILSERRMLGRPIGVLALAAAASADLAGWCVVALATALSVSGSGGEAARTIALAAGFCLALAVIVRPLLKRAATAVERAEDVADLWIACVLASVLLCAYATEQIGIALILGGFAFGLVMPRGTRLTRDTAHEVEGFVRLLLLPLFFGATGLRIDIGLLDRPALWWITALLIVVAIAGKLGGGTLAARSSGFGWRDAATIGALLNTRGLTELVVLNLGLESGLISDALFTALVLMALVTTCMTGPLLQLLATPSGRPAPAHDSTRLQPIQGGTR